MQRAGHLQIAPSLLSADFAALGSEVAAVERGGADMIHVDVMDGHFVPNLTIGPPVVKALRRVAKVPLDVHLMIEEPDRYIEAFVEAGAASLTVHAEAVVHLHRTIQLIKSLGAMAGVALNPATPVNALEEIAGDLDYVLVMTVNPGFGGQTFIPRSESKVRMVRALLGPQREHGPHRSGRRDRYDYRAAYRCRRRRHPRGWPGDLRKRTRRTCHARAARRGDGRGSVLMPSSTSTLRVRYAETDKMGVVYYANYLVWFEVARTDLLRTLSAGPIARWSTRACRCRSSSRIASITGRRGTTTKSRSRRTAACCLPFASSSATTCFDRRTRTLSASGRTVHAAVNRRRAAMPSADAHPRGVRVKALVTGVAGFIGSHLAASLLDGGCDGHWRRLLHRLLSAADQGSQPRRERACARASASPRCGFRTRIWPSLLDGVTHVFHLAAQAGVRKSWGKDFRTYTENNIEATQILLEACVGRPLTRFVHASSSSIYGDAAVGADAGGRPAAGRFRRTA